MYNSIVNGGFETGTLAPFTGANAVIDGTRSHAGTFSTRLAGGTANAFVQQFVPVLPGDGFELFVSMSKIGAAASPPVSITVGYYNGSFAFLGYGLIAFIPSGRLPAIADNDWQEIYQTAAPAPDGATQALVIVNKLPQAGSADILIDDIALLQETPEICFRKIRDEQSAVNRALVMTAVMPKVICSGEAFFVDLNAIVSLLCGFNGFGGLTVDEIFGEVISGNVAFTGEINPGTNSPGSIIFDVLNPDQIHLLFGNAVFDKQSGNDLQFVLKPFVGIELEASATNIVEPVVIQFTVTGQTFLGNTCLGGPHFEGYNLTFTLEAFLVPPGHPCCQT